MVPPRVTPMVTNAGDVDGAERQRKDVRLDGDKRKVGGVKMPNKNR